MSPEVGAVLAEERAARGLTLEQAAAATRIRAHHLEALEAGRLDDLPGPVYGRGYLRAYAAYLGLDGEALLGRLEPRPAALRSGLSIGGVAPSPPYAFPGLALTGPVVAAAGLLLLAALFGLYAFRQFDSLRAAAPPPARAAAAPPIASPPRLAEAAPTPPPAPVAQYTAVVVHTTDTVWLYVEVDGQPFYGASGRFFQAGGEAIFIGHKVKLTSGKASATLVAVDGKDVGALGAGVVTREFAAQN